MPLWDKVKQELDRAGRVAQDALDEGRIRLDAFRARQQADKAAETLGYALFRARSAGSDLDAPTYERMSATLAQHEAEAARLEAQLDAIQGRRRTGYPEDGETGASGATPTDTPPPPSADTVSPTDTGML